MKRSSLVSAWIVLAFFVPLTQARQPQLEEPAPCSATPVETRASTPREATVRVAGLILKWLRGDKEANYRRAERLIRQAAAGGARIVCTTECFLDGYAIKDGLASVPDAPGFGLKLDESKFARSIKPKFDLRLS